MRMKAIRTVVMACLAMMTACAQGARVWYVSSTGSVEQDGSSVDLPTTFQNALEKAAAGDQVLLAAGQYPIGATILIDKALTITGAGIDQTVFVREGNTEVRFFRLNDPAAVLEKVTLKGAILTELNGIGAGVLIDTLGGTFRDSRATECETTGWPGRAAVGLMGEQGLVTRCIIDKNISVKNGDGGGVYMKAGRLEDSLITGNVCLWNGGGVYYLGGSVRNCTIVGNTSQKQKGGGIFWAGEDPGKATLQNLIVTGNTAPSDATKGAPDWSAANDLKISVLEQRSQNCYYGSLPAGVDAVQGEPAFIDPANGDYHLLSGSGMIDAGVAADSMGPSDLDGKPRVSGSAVDVGCYEYDQSVASCGFSADKVSLFAGGSALLTPVAFGAPDGAQLTYSWTLKNMSAGTETNITEAAPSVVFDAAGTYDVTLSVTDGAGYTATATRAAYLLVVPETMYVAPAGQSTPAFPWSTPETAASDLNEAVAKAIDGSTIELLPGEHMLMGQVYLDRAITVKGAGMDETIVTRAPNAAKERLFYLDHAAAVVEDLTVKKSLTSEANQDCFGYGVWVGGRGGTLRRCRVTECQSLAPVERGAVAIMGGAGLVTRCIIDKNKANSHNGPAAGVYMTAGRLESCLIKENVATWQGGGLYYVGGVVRNCTITGNKSGTMGGGIYWEGWSNDPFALQNLIVYGNIADADSGPGAPEWNCGRNEGNFKEKTTHCLFGNGKSVGQDPVIGDPAFVDAPGGDYSLGLGSAAIDKGLAYDGIEEDFDLKGVKRLSGSAIDVGCYEYDWDAPSCGFSVEPSETLEGGTVVLKASVVGVPDPATLEYEWTLTSLENQYAESFSGAEATGSIPRAGRYRVSLVVANGTGFRLTATRTNALHVAVRDSYLARPFASEPAFPWDTPETASTNLLELVSEAGAGTTIHLAAGEHVLADTAILDRAFTISGAGIDKTVVVPAENLTKRLFFLNHPGSVVERLTVKGSTESERDAIGFGVLVGAGGGTLRHCRVTGCIGKGDVLKGAVGISSDNSVVSHCVIDNNRSPIQGEGGGVYMKAGLLENCLVYGNYAEWSGGGIYMIGGGHIRNCTITTNNVGTWGGKSLGGGLYGATADIRKGSIVNCIIAQNIAPVDTTKGSPDWAVNEQSIEPITQILDQVSSNCLFSVGATFGANALSGDPLFKDPGAFDFTLSPNSPAHNAGLYGEWMKDATDLAGRPRVDYKTFVDIGCYETSYPFAPTILILR